MTKYCYDCHGAGGWLDNGQMVTCLRCSPEVADSTPPATPVEPPRCPTCDDATRCGDPFHDAPPATPVEPCQNCMGVDPASCVFCYRSAHPPAASGEGEELLRLAFSHGWAGGFTAIPDRLDEQREQDWEVFKKNFLSTPTPGAPR